ncbi:MAG: hypothetical protein EBS53_05715 [Bacteroidetes bacterium]|nr:hypothetical protein [Bacteroidota bacterium]
MNKNWATEIQASKWLSVQQLPVWKVFQNGEIVLQSRATTSPEGEEAASPLDNSIALFVDSIDLLGDGQYTLVARKKSNADPQTFKFWKGEPPENIPFVDAVNGTATGVEIETPKEREYRLQLEEHERRKTLARKKRIAEEKAESKTGRFIKTVIEGISTYDKNAKVPTGLGQIAESFLPFLDNETAEPPKRNSKKAGMNFSNAQEVTPENIGGTPEEVEAYKVVESTLEALQTQLGSDFIPTMRKLRDCAINNPQKLKMGISFL